MLALIEGTAEMCFQDAVQQKCYPALIWGVGKIQQYNDHDLTAMMLAMMAPVLVSNSLEPHDLSMCSDAESKQVKPGIT